MGAVLIQRGLAVLELDPEATTRALAVDVGEGAADRAGAALDAVLVADQGPGGARVPEVDAGRAEVVAVLALAFLAADRVVEDPDMGIALVLLVPDREELVLELLHANV